MCIRILLAMFFIGACSGPQDTAYTARFADADHEQLLQVKWVAFGHDRGFARTFGSDIWYKEGLFADCPPMCIPDGEDGVICDGENSACFDGLLEYHIDIKTDVWTYDWSFVEVRREWLHPETGEIGPAELNGAMGKVVEWYGTTLHQETWADFEFSPFDDFRGETHVSTMEVVDGVTRITEGDESVTMSSTPTSVSELQPDSPFVKYEPKSWAKIDGLGSFGLSGRYDIFGGGGPVELQGVDTLRFGDRDASSGCIEYDIDGVLGELCPGE